MLFTEKEPGRPRNCGRS